jgi:heptaprenyl diphosphate synthase
VAKKVAFCGMLTALAMIFSYVEALIPVNFGIPGVKLGLANLVVLAGLWILRPHEVLMVSVSRIILISLLFGNGVSLLYSLAGGILSFFVMLGLKKAGFSGIGVSAAGGAAHNIGQLATAALIVQTAGIFWYLPVLLLSGVLTGVLIGILTGRVLAAFGKSA